MARRRRASRGYDLMVRLSSDSEDDRVELWSACGLGGVVDPGGCVYVDETSELVMMR